MEETCLWVLDALKKYPQPQDPYKFRCTPDGKIFCKPCLEKFHPDDSSKQRMISMAHAVSINEKSLDLIATNNGGLKPEIERGHHGHPATYFILPTDPNDHAEILTIESFFEKYEFVGPESSSEFRPVVLR